MSGYSDKDFINRELSWMAFNERVLEEGEDPTTPLLNRLGFLSIVSSNLDEFVMVRVGGLKQVQRSGAAQSAVCPTGVTGGELLDRLRAAIAEQVRRQYACFNNEVRPTLVREGLSVRGRAELDREQAVHLDNLFEEQIYPLLTPLALDETRGLSEVPALTISILVRLRKAAAKDAPTLTAVVPIPAALPRMLIVPSVSGHCFTLIEEAVLMHLERLFAGHEVLETALFRITRDADMSVEQSRDEDFMSAMAEILVQRRESPVVRLELSADASPWARQTLQKMFEIGDPDTFTIPGPLDLKAWWSMVGLGGLDRLRYPAFRPQPSPDLADDADIWETVARRDVLLHHPYESFDAVTRLLREAADDRNVLAIKQVLYRTSGDSPIVNALERAALAGKQVSVLIELKARFDEARNIEWARRLERAGAQVIYGLAGLKVHAKALLIVRRESSGIRRYVHLATGNYNDVTARLYTDFGLLTCNEDFGADVAAFFNMVTGYSQPAAWRKIEVAPLGLRPKLLHLIRRETERAQAGRRGMILAKLNSLSDPEIIEALYDASRAGVKIRVNCRGVCCLRPGVKGVSENIEVVSIVDRFLEHARIYYFRNGGQEEYYLSSADWMTRNINRRVEILFPVEAEPLRKRLADVLDTFLRDNVKGRRLGSDGVWTRSDPGRRRMRAQEAFMQAAEAEAQRVQQRTPRQFRPLKPAEGA
ncbi:MAG: Polyphosphate kinase [Phycisphaerae bacterium]|nr:Polyphosphate kinase [Phycisphaerae bacterium]